MASFKKVEFYTTDFALEAQGAIYKGLIIVNKVRSIVEGEQKKVP